MRKEDFFDILGNLENDIVEEARKPVKEKINRKIWGAAAACLVLLLAVGAAALHRQRDSGIAAGTSTDAAPMVYVNDTLYIQSGDQQGYPEAKDDFIYLGKITSDISNDQTGSNDGTPKENFQANDPIVGCEVYQYGENIVVKINGAYWLYRKYAAEDVSWDDLAELNTITYIESAQAGDRIAIGYLKEDSDISRGELAVYEIIPVSE